MVSFTIRMRFEPDYHEKIVGILKALTEATRKEPGCVTFVPHFVEGENTTVLIYEQYKDEAARDQHRGSPHYAQFVIGGLFQLMKERQVENLTAVS